MVEAQKANHLEEIVVGFESTGSYGEPLQHFLMKRPVKLVQVNPLHTKKLKEVRVTRPTRRIGRILRLLRILLNWVMPLPWSFPKGLRLSFAG